MTTFTCCSSLASAQLYQKSINWDKYTHQQTYTGAMAKADFGSVTGWRDNRAMISDGTLRITIEKNALSDAGGLISNTKISEGSAYELDFDVRFHSQFDWSRGGKVGFGFGIGNGNTGCNVPTDGAGGSLRLMWYNNSNTKRVYFHPYIYHYGMPGPCGSNFGKSYPSSGMRFQCIENRLIRIVIIHEILVLEYYDFYRHYEILTNIVAF